MYYSRVFDIVISALESHIKSQPGDLWTELAKTFVTLNVG